MAPGLLDSPKSCEDSEAARRKLEAKYILPRPSSGRSLQPSPQSSSNGIIASADKCPASLAGGRSLLSIEIPTLDKPDHEELNAARRRHIVLKEAEYLRRACQEGDEKETARILGRYAPRASSSGSSRSCNSSIDDTVLVANVPDATGATAVTYTCIYGNRGCLQLLMDYDGVNLCVTSGKNERNVLHHAAFNGHAALIPLLAQHVNVDATDRLGNTPIHYAVENNFPDAMAALLDAQANLKIVNAAGLTVLAVASRKKRKEMVRALVDLGAVLAASPLKNKHRSASMPALPIIPMTTLLGDHRHPRESSDPDPAWASSSSLADTSWPSSRSTVMPPAGPDPGLGRAADLPDLPEQQDLALGTPPPRSPDFPHRNM